MNIDLTPDELKLIVERLTDEDADLKLRAKLARYALPVVDEDKLVEKYQEWKR